MDLGQQILCNTEDISKELLELTIDSFLKDGIIKNIPVVNTFSAILGMSNSIKNAFFYKKLTFFLYHMDEIPKEERKKFNDKAIKDDTDFGEKLIYVLDNLDDVKKAEYLAKLYKGYAEGIINYEEFRRLCIALTRIFLGDLEYLKHRTISHSEGAALSPLGLYRSSFSGGIGSLRSDEAECFKITYLGRKMYECIFID